MVKLRQVLEICRKFNPASKFPDGHPALAQILFDLEFVLQAARAPPAATRYHQQALTMRQTLYPSSKHPLGHAEIVQSLFCMRLAQVQ